MIVRRSARSRFATFGLLALLLLLAVAPVGPATGSGVPPGHGFYGTVQLDGQDAAVGTVVSARVGGVEYGRWTVEVPGQYALVVQGGIDGGATIDFYVGGWEADQDPFPFDDGSTTPLDLTATTPTYAVTMVADPADAGEAGIDMIDNPPYPAGIEVGIKAVAFTGYRLMNWTAQPEVPFADASSATTTFTMPAQNVTVTASFVPAYALNLTANPEEGGTAVDVTDDAPYAAGTAVNITAVPEQGYMFGNWTSQSEDIIIDNRGAAQTFLTMPAGNVTVTANFRLRPEVPTVTTNAATDVMVYSARLNMTYTTGNFTVVEVRFASRSATDPMWIHYSWVPRTEDGTFSYELADLRQDTEYEFKAQLRYNDTVIEGDVLAFATLPPQRIFLPCFIATAAYGTPAAEEIAVLREFRDLVLAESSAGSRFVALYYRLSPPVANVITESNLMRTLTRELLVDPAVRIVQATGHMWRQ